MPTLPVSFKNTTDEIRLYSNVVSKEDRSNFIKNALRFYLKYKKYENKLIELSIQEELYKNKPTK